jgi:hypothetical protein
MVCENATAHNPAVDIEELSRRAQRAAARSAMNKDAARILEMANQLRELLYRFTNQYHDGELFDAMARAGLTVEEVEAVQAADWHLNDQARFWLEDAVGLRWAVDVFTSGAFEPLMAPLRRKPR